MFRTFASAVALAASLGLACGAAAAAGFSAGVGVADPAIAMNTGGYAKWGQATAAPIIDRMKGAQNRSGRMPSGHAAASVQALSDPAVFSNPGLALDVNFSDDTVIDLSRVLSAAHFNKKLISREQHLKIRRNPEDYFKIETGANGKSELVGRLEDGGQFSTLVRFDRKLDMDLKQLRAEGHVILTSGDQNVGFSQLKLDANGWPISLPTDLAGNVGEVSTIVVWYPGNAGKVPGSIYSGPFYLMADGKGVIDLQQKGKGPGTVNLSNVAIDGPTMVPFQFDANGEQLKLTIKQSDPDHTGDYVRDIHIVHKDHLALFEAGEIFTPEFVDLLKDFRVVRWMGAMEGSHNPAFASGTFDNRPKRDYYSFGLGTNKADVNGMPIDVVVEFANKTGTDPWISVPVNASDDYIQGLADYVEEHLDPRLKVHVEFGNENWNGIFESYHYALNKAHKRWGVLKLKDDGNGQFIRDASGKLIVEKDGWFFPPVQAHKNGFADVGALATELGLGHTLFPLNQGWAEWVSMRSTQVATKFLEVFGKADPQNGKKRVVPVMGTFTFWPKASDLLMRGEVWKTVEPKAWIDPASVFQRLAVGAYFGSETGSRDSDLVSYWLKKFGPEGAKQRVLRELTAGIKPDEPYVRIGPQMFDSGVKVNASKVVRDVKYSPDLIVDVFSAIEVQNPKIPAQIRSATGIKSKKAVLTGDEVHDYVRLAADGGNTALQFRGNPAAGDFQTVLVFDGKVDRTIDQMVDEGTLQVRSLMSLRERFGRFVQQKKKAETYGLKLVAYEGGQHFASAVWGAYRSNLSNKPLTDLLRNLNRSPEIETLYDLWFKEWRKNGGTLFTHYADYGMPSRFGNWGTMDFLGQDRDPEAPLYKLEFLKKLNEQGPWWDEQRDPAAFLQGVTVTAPAKGTALTGTAKQDILFGGSGDDTVAGGPGDDRLGGGGGTNAVDGGDGDDSIVLSSLSDKIDGGSGQDTLRLAHDVQKIDLGTLRLSNLEQVDTRNYARTIVNVDANAVHAMNSEHRLTLRVETADTVNVAGFGAPKSRTMPDGGMAADYTASVQGATVTLSIIKDVAVAAR